MPLLNFYQISSSLIFITIVLCNNHLFGRNLRFSAITIYTLLIVAKVWYKLWGRIIWKGLWTPARLLLKNVRTMFAIYLRWNRPSRYLLLSSPWKSHRKGNFVFPKWGLFLRSDRRRRKSPKNRQTEEVDCSPCCDYCLVIVYKRYLMVLMWVIISVEVLLDHGMDQLLGSRLCLTNHGSSAMSFQTISRPTFGFPLLPRHKISSGMSGEGWFIFLHLHHHIDFLLFGKWVFPPSLLFAFATPQMFLFFIAFRQMPAQGSSHCKAASTPKALEKGLAGLGLVVELDASPVFGIEFKAEQFSQTFVVFSVEEADLRRNKSAWICSDTLE